MVVVEETLKDLGVSPEELREVQRKRSYITACYFQAVTCYWSQIYIYEQLKQLICTLDRFIIFGDHCINFSLSFVCFPAVGTVIINYVGQNQLQEFDLNVLGGFFGNVHTKVLIYKFSFYISTNFRSLRWPIAVLGVRCRASCVHIFFSRTTGPILSLRCFLILRPGFGDLIYLVKSL